MQCVNSLCEKVSENAHAILMIAIFFMCSVRLFFCFKSHFFFFIVCLAHTFPSCHLQSITQDFHYCLCNANFSKSSSLALGFFPSNIQPTLFFFFFFQSLTRPQSCTLYHRYIYK